jgi:hypothetical protein
VGRSRAEDGLEGCELSVDELTLKYGKTPATHDRRDLLMVEFVDHKLVELKEAAIGFGIERDLGDWGMLGNDRYGDCAWAGPAHEHMLTTRLSPVADADFTADGVLSDYAACTGFNPATGAGDNGTNMRDGLNYRRHIGIVDSTGTRHKIGGFCALEPGNFSQLLQALEIFDVVAMGIEVAESCEQQFAAGKPWSVVPGAQIVGGHYVPVFARPSVAMGECVTWARRQPFTEQFYGKYNDEAYGVFTTETLTAGRSPEGFNLDDFNEALAQL